MSDFITRLAQRQLGEVKTAKPRLPERYAPALSLEPSRSLDLPPRQTLVPALVQSPTSRSGHARVVEGELQQQPVGETIARNSSQRPEAAVTGRRSEAERLDSSGHPQFEVSSQTGAQEPAQTETNRVSARRFISEDTQRDAGVARTRLLPRTTAADRLSAPPPLPSSRDGIAPSSARFERPDAEPPVHVTIGRIEVSALAQPLPVKRVPAARKPSMSLEDYLTRRQRRES
jgi:hypothetical protein